MSRDHTKLRVFTLADDLVMDVYRGTRDFSNEERFGLQAQLRRAAVSAATNIVEGCARDKTPDYVRFLVIALGSGSEARYLIDLSHRLGYVSQVSCLSMVTGYTELLKGLQRMITTLGGTHGS